MSFEDRLYIIAATHEAGRAFAHHYGMPENGFKTITLASSLRGMRRDARIVWLQTGVHHPDAGAIDSCLRERFINVLRLDSNGKPISS